MLSPASIYLFRVNNGNTNSLWNLFKIKNKDTKTTSLTSFWRRSGAFIVGFEHISSIVLVFPLLSLNKYGTPVIM